MGLTRHGLELVAQGQWNMSAEDVAKDAIELVDESHESNKELRGYVKELLVKLEGTPRKMSKPKLFEVNGDVLAFHQLGLLRTHGDAEFVGREETDKFWIGNFCDCYLNFVNIWIEKEYCTETTEEELDAKKKLAE
ncbi:putative membrane protein [Bacillus phage SP-15]|uniref:Putative membrane protein n=1 Tax=Bacillus phage SP-15 TaxID=1792032 RepID=A0A127AWW5_9CAUD|nr:hypothetical protein SP15_302 [Bacillus phage SP-15]AMM45110.1 putative membrane protein [Bacillus phage SP-15]